MNSYQKMLKLLSNVKACHEQKGLSQEEKCYVMLLEKEILLLNERLQNIYNMENFVNYSTFCDTWIGYYNNKLVEQSIDNINKIIDVDESLFTEYILADSKNLIQAFFNYTDSNFFKSLHDRISYNKACW